MLDIVYEYDPRKERIKAIDKFIVIMSIAMLAVIPLLMFRHDTVSYSPLFLSSNYATGNKLDVFNYFKAVAIFISSCTLLWALLYKIVKFKYELKKSKLNYFVIVFAMVVMISPLFSKYTDIALLGNFDRYEGAVAWFSYLAIFFVLFNTNIESKYYKYFYLAFIPFIVINLFTSLSNILGYNLLDNEFVNSMMGGGLSGYLVTTLYHPNFGSAISAVIFSVSFMYQLIEEDNKLKIILLITTTLSFAMLLAMISSGGFVTMLIVLPVLIVIAVRLTNIKNVLKWGGLTLVLNTIVYTIISKLDERVYNESFAIISKINDISPILIPFSVLLFVGVVFGLKFINRKKAFDIVTSLIIIFIFIGLLLVSNIIEKEKTVLDENPNESIVRIRDNNIYQKLNEMSTDRINIWMKTIDLINDKPLLGHGFDTLPYIMYEEDEDKGMSTYGEYIDKPHNWYLTVAYGCGLIGLSGLLAVLIYIIRGLFYNLSDKIQNKYLHIYGIGVLAYAVQGLSNDSLGGTSIMFWIMAGLCASQLSIHKTN